MFQHHEQLLLGRDMREQSGLQAELSMDPSVDALKSLVSGDTDVRPAMAFVRLLQRISLPMAWRFAFPHVDIPPASKHYDGQQYVNATRLQRFAS